MEQRIELIDLDFGNVIGPFDTQRWMDFLRTHWPDGGREPDRFFYAEYFSLFDLDQINERGLFRLMSQRGFKASEYEFLFELTAIMRIDPRMIALKQVLKQNGFKLAIVSNMNRYHFEHIKQMWPEVFEDFDYLALSFQLRVKKPDFRIFDAPAENLGVPPERCFLIDDLKENIDAFEHWGGVGHYYNVIDEKFCPNGRLETERNRLVLRMVNLGMLSLNQAGSIVRIDF